MAQEVELKLSLPEKEQRRFLREAISPGSVKHDAVRLVNIYYDTPDLALYRKGIALRLRKNRQRWIQTVKCAGNAGAGLSTRPEWESPYSGQFDFADVDDKATKKRLNRLKAGLVPIFETRFLRNEWVVSEPNAELQISLDRGSIVANGKTEKISEVEIELVSGDIQHIFSFAAGLMHRFALGLGNLSKAERGYHLNLDRQEAPTHATPVKLDRKEPPAQAFLRIACSSLDHVQRNHHGALLGHDVEYVHQMRVGIRRLLAALSLFKPTLPKQMHDPKPSWLRSLMKTLGDARDLDVVLSDVIAPVVRCNPHQANIAKLIEIVGQRQTKARSNVARALDAPDHGLHLLAIQSQLQTAANQKEVTNTKLENFADQRLRHLRKKILGLADNRIAEDPQSLHRLRIAAKRLRYALEFFSTLQKGKRIANLIKQLAKLQNTLGRLNDLSNAELILLDCAGNDPDLLQAVNFIGNAHRQSRVELVDEVSRILTKFRSMDFPIFGE